MPTTIYEKVLKSEQIVCSQRILNQIPKLRASEASEKKNTKNYVWKLSDKQLYVNLDKLLERPKAILPPPYKIIGGPGPCWPPPPPLFLRLCMMKQKELLNLFGRNFIHSYSAMRKCVMHKNHNSVYKMKFR